MIDVPREQQRLVTCADVRLRGFLQQHQVGHAFLFWHSHGSAWKKSVVDARYSNIKDGPWSLMACNGARKAMFLPSLSIFAGTIATISSVGQVG